MKSVTSTRRGEPASLRRAVTFGYNTGESLRAREPDLIFDDYGQLLATLTA